MAAISKRFELESWDWAHSLHLFELFPIVIKSLVVGGRDGGTRDLENIFTNL